MERAGAVERVHEVCNRFPPPIVALCEQLFGDNMRQLGELLYSMVSAPLIFGTQQQLFHAALATACGVVETDDTSAPVLHYVSDNYTRHGIVHVELEALLKGLCTVMLQSDRFPPMTELTAVPCRIMSALIFGGADAGYPQRAWALRRFLVADCADARQWSHVAGDVHRRMAQTPEFMDLLYMESAIQCADPRKLDERARINLRATMCDDPRATIWNNPAAMQRVMDYTRPRTLLTFYMYFLQCMYAAGFPDAQRYWELAFAMLMDMRVDLFMPIVASVAPATLDRIAELVEDMRTFLARPFPTHAGTVTHVQALYARTCDFHKAFLPNRDVRSMILNRATARRFMELFYVPVSECKFSELVAGLCTGPQVGQLHALMTWLTATTPTWSLAHAMTQASAAHRNAIDAALYTCTLPAGARIHRVHWTLEHMARAHPTLFGSLTTSAYVGLNQNNHPYLVMPRDTMEALRIVMLTDALTMRSYRKSTAVYPLLMRLYLTQRRDGRAHLDTLGLMAFAHIVGYWLYAGENGNSTFERDGMPQLGESTEHIGLLHQLLQVLDAPSLSMATLNAVRSYLMIKTPHRMTSFVQFQLMRIARDDPDWQWLRQAAECMASVLLTANVRRPGRPRADASRQLPTTSVLAHEQFTAELCRRYPHNPLCARAPAARLPLFHFGVYAFAMTLGGTTARSIINDFLADTTVLTDRDYCRARYNVPTDFAGPWQQSNDFFASTLGTRYCHADHALRPELENADFAPLIRFLQQLEYYVCASDVARQAGPGVPSPSLSGADPALLRELNNVYRDPERVLHTMPIASYFNAQTGHYNLTEWETSIAIADALPAAMGGVVTNPASRAVSGDSVADSQLTDVAVDVVAMFSPLFDEQRIIDPGHAHNFRRQAALYRTKTLSKQP